MNEMILALAEPLSMLLTLLVSLAVGWAVTVLERKTGIQVSEAREAKIKRAATTAILSYLAKRNLSLADTTPEQRLDMVREAMGHVLGDGAGDSAKRVKASAGGLERVIEGQMARLQIEGKV